MGETVQKRLSLPDDLDMQLVVGEASFALALLRATGELPEEGVAVLRRLASLLRESSTSLQPQASSLSGSAGDLDWAIAANHALGTRTLDVLTRELGDTADTLTAVADTCAEGAQPPKKELDRLHKTVRLIEEAVESAGALPTDEIAQSPS